MLHSSIPHSAVLIRNRSRIHESLAIIQDSSNATHRTEKRIPWIHHISVESLPHQRFKPSRPGFAARSISIKMNAECSTQFKLVQLVTCELRLVFKWNEQVEPRAPSRFGRFFFKFISCYRLFEEKKKSKRVGWKMRYLSSSEPGATWGGSACRWGGAVRECFATADWPAAPSASTIWRRRWPRAASRRRFGRRRWPSPSVASSSAPTEKASRTCQYRFTFAFFFNDILLQSFLGWVSSFNKEDNLFNFIF